MSNFGFHQVAGYITPGAVALLGLLALHPDPWALLQAKAVSAGALGVLCLLAYAAGHVVQGVGSLFESRWWRLLGGRPSYRALSLEGDLLSPPQRAALRQRLAQRLLPTTTAPAGERPLPETVDPLAGLSKEDLLSVTRQVFAAVAAQDRAKRIDTFSGNHLMNRGLAVALLAAAAAAAYGPGVSGTLPLGLLAAAVVAWQRMHHFSKLYAQELFVQFLELPPEPTPGPTEEAPP